MKSKLVLLALTAFVIPAFAQSYKETFDANSLNWTECAFESNNGTAIIDNGVLTVTSKGENKGLGAALSVMSGTSVKVGENTFFETHCYAPIDVQKPFEIIANVTIDKLGSDRMCGFVFNYRDGGTFYAFTFNDDRVNFVRYEDNKIVGSIYQGVKWANKKKMNQQWKMVSDGDVLSFYVDDMEILKVKYMPITYSGVGFYTFGKQKLIVDDIEFVQL